MKRALLFIALAANGWLVLSLHAAAPKPAPDGPLILISIDGFRWDYLQIHDAPTLKALAKDGVHATRMTPSFPSKTFPNHYTLVTGLYPENHGIVANWFFDPETKEMFGMKRTETHWWAGGEPVWITAEKQGITSGCFFWPGSEAVLQQRRPNYWKPFDITLSPDERVDGLLQWLALPATKRPKLCTLYFDHTDTAGHKFGPFSTESRDAVKSADEAIARLLKGLKKLGMAERTNLVIVSDHGMSEISPDKIIFLDDLMDLREVQIESTGPNGGVRPLKGDARALAEEIRAKAPPQLQVFLREEVPARFHYNHGDRIPPVVLMAEDHWNIEERKGWAARQLTYNRGSHGWDPTTPNMGALFIAHGPAFRPGVEIPDVENIHVYNLLCAVLRITPAPNDGDDRLVKAALVNRQPLP